MNKEVLRIAKQNGFVLARQKKHYVFKHPSGAVFCCGKTLSDKRALENIEKEMKRTLRKQQSC